MLLFVSWRRYTQAHAGRGCNGLGKKYTTLLVLFFFKVILWHSALQQGRFLLYLPLTIFTYYMTSCSDWSHCGNLAEKVFWKKFVFDRFHCQKQFFFFLARNVIMWEGLFRFPFKRCHNFKKRKFCRINRGAESDKRQMPDDNEDAILNVTQHWIIQFKLQSSNQPNNATWVAVVQSAVWHWRWSLSQFLMGTSMSSAVLLIQQMCVPYKCGTIGRKIEGSALSQQRN